MISKFCILIFISISSYTTAQNKPATIKEYKKIFKTYLFSDPDPIPKPDTKIYPYSRFDGYTDNAIQKEWKVIELENDYLRIMILPEVGGKIWSAVEKSTGKDFIYNNHVIKFRDIAMRGPWTSGGIEANYGIIGHTPNCATPVDYITFKKEDGSVSCMIGVLDLITRTTWKLDINLPVDKAYFTTNSFWYNASSFEQPYYTWMNAGIKAEGNLQFIYPGKNYLGHEGEYSDWPINKKNNKDISFYNNNNFGGYKSYHVFGKYTDFFGGYWHDEDFGMGRFASHDDKAGKKIWIWGLSQQGMIWEKLLTDTDGQYVEVQSGRLYNQSGEKSIYTPFKHRSFSPSQSDVWTEYWFPVKQTKGYVKANNYGSINIKNEGGWLKIYFSPLQFLNEKLEVLENNKTIYSKDISVKPMQLFTDSIKVQVDESKLKVVFGVDKLIWNSSPNDGDLNRPMEISKDFDHNSVYGLYLQGKNNISFRDYVKAEEKLNACLQKDPNYVPALVDMASLLIRRFKYVEAVQATSKALSINTYDPAANYYYALANLYLGNTTDAKDGFDIAALSTEYRSASYLELSRIHFRDRELSKSLESAEKSLISNQYNLDALQLLVVIYRLQNNTEKAEESLRRILKLDPLNHFVHFEKYMLDNAEVSKNYFTSNIQNEMPQQTFLELGIWYHSLNRSEEAIKFLSLSPASVEVLYWKSYLENKPVEINEDKVSVDFPFRTETAGVLAKLMKTNNHWMLKYHLGLIEWNRNNIAKAIVLFNECGSLPKDPSFFAARATLLNIDAESVVADLQHAIKLNNHEWRYSKLLAEHYIKQKQYDKALVIVKPFYEANSDNYIIGMLYARTLLLTNKYKAADDFLTKLKILPFEGATVGRQLYVEAKLMQAVAEIKNKQYKKALKFSYSAKLWPSNLGVGKPYDEEIDERLEDWLIYTCNLNLGNKDVANQSLQKIIAFTPKVDNTVLNFSPANHLVSAWAIEKSTSQKAAEDWLQSQAKLFPENKIIQWSLRAYHKEKFDLAIEEKVGGVRVLEQLMQQE